MIVVANVLLIVAGVLVVAARDRRALAIAFGAVPLATGLVELESGPGGDALPLLLARLVAGITAALVLALGIDLRQAVHHPARATGAANLARAPGDPAAGMSLVAVLGAALLAFGAYSLARGDPLVGIGATFAVCWLIGIGAFAAFVATELFRLGVGLVVVFHGLLLAITAFGLADGRVVGAGAVWLVGFALAVAYLIYLDALARNDAS